MFDRDKTKRVRKSGNKCTHESPAAATTDLIRRALQAYDRGVLSVSEVARIIVNEMTLQSIDEILLSIQGRVDVLRELLSLIRGWSAVSYEIIEA